MTANLQSQIYYRRSATFSELRHSCVAVGGGPGRWLVNRGMGDPELPLTPLRDGVARLKRPLVVVNHS